ncbi:MAG: VTT domain-containing protein [Candidatus Brocadiaceae bacterium]
MGLTIVAGMLFGMVWGTAYVAVGGALSTIIGFYFARWMGRNAIERLVRKNSIVMEMERRCREYGKNAVLYMRLFNVPWDMVSYWAGLSGIKFKDFYVASMIPLVPVSFLYTYFGSQVFTPKSAGFIISLTIMILMGSIPSIKARYKKKLHD